MLGTFDGMVCENPNRSLPAPSMYNKMRCEPFRIITHLDDTMEDATTRLKVCKAMVIFLAKR